MNDFKRIVLEKHSQRIISDVTDPQDILIHLQSKHILQSHEVAAISSTSNATAKLVNFLVNQKDGLWFEEFVEALFKDYRWISESLKQAFYDEENAKMTFYLSGRGNVPPLPQHNVTRKQYVQQLRHKIEVLKRDQYLVIHGMSGCGKTCLAVDSLNDLNLIENSLRGCVYWLSVGDLKNDDPDDLQCHQLRQKLCDMVNIPINSQKDLLQQLRVHFSIKPDYDALLILDDVLSPKVIKALNIGCKVLVTTQDSGVMKEFKNKVLFAVNGGFSESESVQLLKDFVLDGPGELLPSIKNSAQNIHRVWKGHPMVIGLIGGVLAESKEESLQNQSKWKEYERNLTHTDHDNNVSRRRSIVEEQMSSIIELTMDKLDIQSKNLYEMLAVLVEDTNITLGVLEILWGLDHSEVRDTMDHFYRRSLVFKKFNTDLNAPIYGIHDILIEHLKKKFSKIALQNMHKSLILKYNQACSGDFSKLPADNYIYSYLCHHIDYANEWNKFRKQFFSLPYIESKLKATGPGDLLLDLHKYEVGLVGDDEKYSSMVQVIRRFVEKYGWDIHQNDIDVVQGALLEPLDSFLYEQGAMIASERNLPKIYFYPENIPRERPKELEKFANAKSVSIITTNSANHSEGRILIYPDEERHIVELDLNYRQKRRSFKVDSEVVKLKMSPLSDKFLSASSSGCVDIWNLTLDGSSNANTPPPSLRQRSYVPYFAEMSTTSSHSFKHTRRVTCACFSSDGKLVVSSSEDGTVCVWNLELNQKVEEIKVHPDPYPVSCSFVRGDEMIVYGCQNFKIFFYNLNSRQREHCWKADENCGDLLDVLCMPDEFRKVLVVQEKAIKLCTWEDLVLRHTREGPRRTELLDFDVKVLHKETKKVTCAAYYNKHLIIGTSDGCHLYFNVLDRNCPPVKFGSGNIKAVDMVASRIAFAQHDVVKMCWPEPDNEFSTVNQPLNAHLGWNNRGVSVYATATDNRTIQVFHDGKLVADKFCRDICIVHVSTHGNQILIGTKEGNLMLFDVVSGSFSQISNFGAEIKYLSAEMLGIKPLYLAAAAEQPNVEGTYILQVVMFENPHMQCRGINAPIVKTFLCHHQFLMVVLRDYSVMVWDLKSKMEYTIPIQEGREAADITDACLSQKEDVLVLSDTENCYHLLYLSWPDDSNNLTDNFDKNVFINSTKKLNLNLGQLTRFSSSTDEVDGTVFSSGLSVRKLCFRSRPLSSSSWCCCVCTKGEIVAFGCGRNEVYVRDVQQKKVFLKYSVLPNRRTKVSLVKFSPYDITLRNKVYKLILCVVTDCLSLWDISPFVNDNALVTWNPAQANEPECLACVKADGHPIVELSVNPSFSKFCAFDLNGTYFLWKVWEGNTLKR